MQAVNQCTLKSMRQSAQQSAQVAKGKKLIIPKGKLVLLHDHPEGHNKTQDQYKE